MKWIHEEKVCKMVMFKALSLDRMLSSLHLFVTPNIHPSTLLMIPFDPFVLLFANIEPLWPTWTYTDPPGPTCKTLLSSSTYLDLNPLGSTLITDQPFFWTCKICYLLSREFGITPWLDRLSEGSRKSGDWRLPWCNTR